MDFFGLQEAARRATRFLIAYFILCVILIVGSVYLVVLAFWFHAQGKLFVWRAQEWWNPELFVGVGVATLLIIALGSLYKIRKLSGGGMGIARMLGGRPVDCANTGPRERVLLNVVEEMAIASGMTVPPVYLLPDQEGINAFAAGFTPGSAVIGVTQGGMERLSRDELQGVIAHEFSHILSGDMRLNIRLMGVIHGILIISIVGRVLMRTRGRKNPLPLLGAALYLIGIIGVLFGHLIKAAVSRQREFLADAASVQFTRNPDGIAGALKRIGGLPAGSRIDHALAEEMSHFYFSNGLREAWFRVFATHPNLTERIRRIDPAFDGTFPKGQAEPSPVPAFRPAAAAEKFSPQKRMAVDVHSAMASIGAPGLEHLVWAAALITSIPTDVAVGARDPAGAQAIIFALLLSGEPEVEKAQVALLQGSADSTIVAATMKFAPRVRTLGPEYRLPLVQMATSALAQFSEKNFSLFCEQAAALIEADHRIDLFELMLQELLVRQLGRRFQKRPPSMRSQPAALEESCVLLLSTLARVGNRDEGKAAAAFAKGRERLKPGGAAIEMLPAAPADFRAVGDALAVLDQTVPALKRRIMEACVACVAADGMVTVEEAELVRAVAAALDCPMPPMLGKAI